MFELFVGLIGLVVTITVIVAIFDIRKLLAAILKELRARPHVALLALMLLAAGCATDKQLAEFEVRLNDLRSQVRVTSNPNAVKDCRFITNVVDEGPQGEFRDDGWAGTGIWSGERSLLEKAVRAGGNALFTTEKLLYRIDNFGTGARGEVYFCESTSL